jgi:hypothetical protein
MVQNNPGSKQRYDFRGKPNDGTIPDYCLNLQFTLTEPIHLQSIYQLFEQTNCTGIAYFWRQDKQFHILLRIIKAVVFLFRVGQVFMCLQPSMMVLVMKVR